jgi:hypothetical protein
VPAAMIMRIFDCCATGYVSLQWPPHLAVLGGFVLRLRSRSKAKGFSIHLWYAVHPCSLGR